MVVVYSVGTGQAGQKDTEMRMEKSHEAQWVKV